MITPVTTTDPAQLKACIAEALRVAEMLRRDLILHPPAEADVLERAWARVLAHWDEAQRWTDAYVRAVLACRGGVT